MSDRTRKLILMCAFGFVSGLPLYLSGFTFRQWLTESGASLETIGLMASLGLPYTFKFLWAPVLDQIAAPGPFGRLGRRRGWLLLMQPLLMLSILWLALGDPVATPLGSITAAACVAFCSATQDIAIDAWRIEIFPPEDQGLANAVYVWGYRAAMAVASSGVLWAVGLIGWHAALGAIAALAAAGILVTLLSPEPVVALPPRTEAAVIRVARAAWDSLREFLGRPGAWLILAYVALFNLGEAMAGVMLAPFYRFLGFDRRVVAQAIFWPNLIASMGGIFVGGILVRRLGVNRALILTGFLQMAMMAMYVALSRSPGDEALLYLTVLLEAFAQGLATAAFLAYLSTLTARQYTATQFALLTSVAPLAANTLGGLSGYAADGLGWTGFYVFAMACALPGLLLMLVILRRYPARGLVHT
jgi:PAT family beta-lactamase induction signal transducer AmpG